MRLVHGVGVNDSMQPVHTFVNGVKTTCPFYKKWADMLQRCYSQKYQNRYPRYKGCSVHPSWFSFQTFKGWMKTKDWKGKHLDKDIKVFGNKIYGPETCIFIENNVNTLFNTREGAESDLPVGVSVNKYGKYETGCSFGSGRVHIGTYSSVKDASLAYISAKSKYIESVVSEMKDTENKQFVISYAENFISRLHEQLRTHEYV